MRAALLVALLLLLGVAAKKKDDKEDGADRMRAEIDAHGEMAEEQSAEMAQHEAAAKAGLNVEYSDALKDIMGARVRTSNRSALRTSAHCVRSLPVQR